MKRKTWDFADEQLIREKLTIVRMRLENRGKDIPALLAICYDELKWTGDKRRPIKADSQFPWHVPTPRAPRDPSLPAPPPKKRESSLYIVVPGNLNSVETLTIAHASSDIAEVNAFAENAARKGEQIIHVFELRESFQLVPTIQRTVTRPLD